MRLEMMKVFWWSLAITIVMAIYWFATQGINPETVGTSVAWFLVNYLIVSIIYTILRGIRTLLNR